MKTYYHNMNRDLLNESDSIEFIESYEDGDKVYKSEDGCAYIYPLNQQEIDDLKKEYQEFNAENSQQHRTGR
jgi:hypothetical protein